MALDRVYSITGPSLLNHWTNTRRHIKALHWHSSGLIPHHLSTDTALLDLCMRIA